MTSVPRPDARLDAAVPIHERAAEHLRVIRDAMERAGSFTAVPGWGTVGIGVTALAAAALAPATDSGAAWLRLWVVEGCVAAVISAAAIARKARRLGLPLDSGPVRKFALAFLPTLAAGGVLTAVFARQGSGALLPGTWLLLYGAAVTAAGSMSVRIIPAMGAAFMVLGVAALAVAPAGANAFMAAGFGALHVLFGAAIARRHGG